METKKKVTLADLPDDVRLLVKMTSALVVIIARETGDPDAHREVSDILAIVWEGSRFNATAKERVFNNIRRIEVEVLPKVQPDVLHEHLGKLLEAALSWEPLIVDADV